MSQNPAFGWVTVGQKQPRKRTLLPIRVPATAKNKPGHHDTTGNKRACNAQGGLRMRSSGLA